MKGRYSNLGSSLYQPRLLTLVNNGIGFCRERLSSAFVASGLVPFPSTQAIFPLRILQNCQRSRLSQFTSAFTRVNFSVMHFFGVSPIVSVLLGPLQYRASPVQNIDRDQRREVLRSPTSNSARVSHREFITALCGRRTASREDEACSCLQPTFSVYKPTLSVYKPTLSVSYKHTFSIYKPTFLIYKPTFPDNKSTFFLSAGEWQGGQPCSIVGVNGTR
jgi:hypothetical protein